MLSVIIATRNSERPLVRTLAALVPGATSGLITEVLIADAGSRDDTPAARISPAASFSPGTSRSAAACKRPRMPRARRGFCSCSRGSCSTLPGSRKCAVSSSALCATFTLLCSGKHDRRNRRCAKRWPSLPAPSAHSFCRSKASSSRRISLPDRRPFRARGRSGKRSSPPHRPAPPCKILDPGIPD